MATDACIAAIRAAAPTRQFTPDELVSITEEVQRQVREQMALGKTPRAAKATVATAMQAEAKAAAARAKWSAYNDILKMADREAENRPAYAMLSDTGGGTTRNYATSVENSHKALLGDLLYRQQAELKAAKVDKRVLSRDPVWENKLAAELDRREDPTRGPSTGDKSAEDAARILGKTLDASRAMQNRQGAFIGKVEGYMPQAWDMWKARGDGSEAAFQKWKEIFGKNRDKDFAGLLPQQIEAKLRGQWQAIKSGVFGSIGDAGGHYDLGARVSQSRTINFNTAADWVAANRAYGIGGIADAVSAHADRAARNTAVMEMFGNKPKQLFDALREKKMNAAHALNTEAGNKIGDALKASRNSSLFGDVTGIHDIPGDHRISTINANVRALSQMIHLGSILAGGQALIHIPLNAMAHRLTGGSFLEGMATQLRGVFGKDQDMAHAVHAGSDALLQSTIRRFHSDDGSVGQRMAGFVNSFYKATGFSGFMDNQKGALGVALTHYLGRAAGKTFDQLDPRWQTSLTRYGIEAPEWDAARPFAQKASDGRMHLIPADIADAGVSRKFQNYVTGHVAQGANEPTAWARNVVVGGTRAGTPAGEIARYLTQFKSFAVTMMQRQFGSLLRGGVDVPGIMLLASSAMGMGFIGGQLHGLLTNQHQNMPTDAEGWVKLLTDSAVRGGVFGLLGDAMLRDGMRSGSDVAKQLVGPVGEPLVDLIGALNNVRQGPGEGSRTTRGQEAIEGVHKVLGDITPNFWATSAVYNYLFPYMVANTLHPGAVQRHQEVMRKNNQSWYIPPSP